MKCTAAEIEAALADYRKVAAARNKRLLEVYIDAIIRAKFTDEAIREETSDEEWHEEQLLALGELVGGDLKELGISAPAELLDRFDDLAAGLCLDGTTGGDLDPEERAARIAVYFDALNAALKDKAPEEVREIISAPEEFRVLARHVIEINGAMLPDDMTKYTLSFWQDDGMYDHSKIPGRVSKLEGPAHPYDTFEHAVLVWDSGMVIGGRFGCFYVQESDGNWEWKFVYQGEGDERIFDNIPELFQWYLWTLERDPPNLEGLTAEAVMNRAY